MESPTTDVLSRVLAHCKSERAVTARFTLSAPWALRSAGVEGLLLRLCRGEPYWLQCGELPPQRLAPHDIAMLPRGDAHTVSSAPGVTPEAFRPLIEQHMVGRHGEHPIAFVHGAGGAATELHSLHLWLPARGLAAVLDTLPPLVVLRAQDAPTTAALAVAAEQLVDESLAQRPGWQLTAARMGDLLLTHVLREHLAAPAQTQAPTAWLHGLQDEGIARAVALMHGRPQQAWSVEALARAAHMSRTVFSERFRGLLGVTPAHYLTSCRMLLAADRLKDPQQRLPEVAEAVGYQSEKAFARAFQRWTGLTPAAYARREAG